MPLLCDEGHTVELGPLRAAQLVEKKAIYYCGEPKADCPFEPTDAPSTERCPQYHLTAETREQHESTETALVALGLL